MRILIINPIPYTSETCHIKRASSIKDTMIYDLCLAFHEQGHEVTLWVAEPYEPCCEEIYPFAVWWGKCVVQRLFMVHRFPVMPDLYRYICDNREYIDLIITSEVFSINSLLAYWLAPEKTIIWHELAKHNAMMRKIPSKIWYGIVARMFMRKAKIVTRSEEAKRFIKQFCCNVDEMVIDHGVNMSKFLENREKLNCFVVCSQLITRKRIDGILRKFADYLHMYDPVCRLYIIGDGDMGQELKDLAETLKISERVTFTGRLNHGELMPILSKAQAMLVNTEKDNSMISIVESIVVGTPVVTTDIPLNATYIRENQLGIAKSEWDAHDLHEVVVNNAIYVENCIAYRKQLSTEYRVEQFKKVSGRID